MGFYRHQAVIVMTYGDDAPNMDAFRATLPEDFARLVVGPIAPAANGGHVYAFLPDGSKEGWNISNAGDDHRAAFLALFNRAHIAAASWGDGEPQIQEWRRT